MTYNYKGTNLTNILQSGTAITGYAGLTGIALPAGETSSLPYNFGYSINGQSLSNAYIAKYTDYTTSTVATVPAGATHMRIIAIGGGGSGGGNGGNARANVNTTSYHTGGDGGKGSCGSYATSNDVILQGSNIQIQIGTGGAAGANGANDSDNNVTGSAKATGQNGFTNPGIATVIIHNGITYSASGGIGGVGGKGGDSAANEPGGQSGSDGANGQPNYTQIATTPATWPSLSQYGIGGNGGTKNNAGDIITNATAGGDGAARIIWLYQ